MSFCMEFIMLVSGFFFDVWSVDISLSLIMDLYPISSTELFLNLWRSLGLPFALPVQDFLVFVSLFVAMV